MSSKSMPVSSGKRHEAPKGLRSQVIVREPEAGRDYYLDPLPIPADFDREANRPMPSSETVAPVKKIRRRPLLWLEALFLIMGVIFFAWPTVKTVRGHAEGNLAITRAEALNNATTWLVQERGQETAEVEWSAAATDQGRYELLMPYLAFAPEKFEDYMNWRYLVVLPKDLKTLAKIELIEGTPMDY